MREKRRKQSDFPFAVILLLVLILAAILCLLVWGSRKTERKEGPAYEVNVVAGDTPGKSKEERQRELDSVVEEGMPAMSINATLSGRGVGSERFANWLIENPSNQGRLIRMEIYQDDTGEKIYEMGVIKPGGYVEAAPSDANLSVGEYDCTARFYIYRLETEEYIGQAAAKIKLVICEWQR